ncbi:MAG: bifunctional phosphoribosyl-AMP cyclohydrolase/phosphoribosyl-ATP diphosphatase HisIE [Sediminibacterium sp.]|nr:bifunctional phosphoribosyl-AMP cyclohydrolase/phosphoribosyl-ATP diphosphatase HisIE [Sediminibacterium sp.]
MEVNFLKYQDGLAPAIIQDSTTLKVLMLGFMNAEALDKTIHEKRVTFYSRSKQRLWTKGEESGNYLWVNEIKADCDNDTLLIKVKPAGPVCHTGTDTCWSEANTGPFIPYLEKIIEERIHQNDGTSYVNTLFKKGINKIAQKVGEEAVELIIEAKDTDDKLFLNEAADLLFHYLVLLRAKGYSLKNVESVLKNRHLKSQ